MAREHLVKILAARAVASRRGSERMIREGLVTVDGQQLLEPGQLVDPAEQRIEVNGEPLPKAPALVYRLLHKPTGTITSRSDPEGRNTVFDLLDDAEPSLQAVGRLDYNTEGVLLLTNDGELAYRLTHPSYAVPKSYLVKISSTPSERKLEMLRKGVRLEDGPTEPALVEIIRSSGPSSWLLITIKEGRNRIVRRLVDHIGHRTLKLKRVAFGGLTLRGLEAGDTRKLSAGELGHLRRGVRVPGKVELKVSWEVRKAVAELLRMPLPPRERKVRSRDDEGRPYRGKGWARPKVRKARSRRPGKKHDKRGSAGSGTGPRRGGGRSR
ncbi:MAG: pseudouridine synthase [Rickettsiales bacterium]|nr:pseudouridine synthase [Rickettsiales bacterium]